MCTFNQSGKYQVKYVNVYIKPLVDELLKLWDDITIYDISRPIGQRGFQFNGILTWTIHDALGLANFCGL